MNSNISDFYKNFESIYKSADNKGLKKIIDDEIRRENIITEALKKKKDLETVNEELDASLLRRIYERNPEEFILSFCLRYNGIAGVKKYGLKEYDSLKEKMIVGQKESCKKKCPLILVGDLYQYVKCASKNEGNDAFNEGAKTATITFAIRDILQNSLLELENKKENPDELLVSLFEEHKKNMKDTYETIRYYISKYILFAIWIQVKEFKSLLMEYSKRSTQNDLETRLNKMVGNKNQWSLCYNSVDLLELDRPKRRQSERQYAKNMLQVAIGNMPLFGSPNNQKYDCSPLFTDKNGNPQSISKLRDKTYIFENGYFKDEGKERVTNHKEHHDEVVKWINELNFEHFFGFKLDCKKIYNLLFGKLTEKEPLDDMDEFKKAYIYNLLQGKRDITRSAVLIFLSSIKGVMCNVDSCLPSEFELFKENEKDNTLSFSRVNNILSRMGFIDIDQLGEVDAVDEKEFESEFDGMFMNLFDTDEMSSNEVQKNINDLVDALGAEDEYAFPYMRR